jgi:hypothetical protein
MEKCAVEADNISYPSTLYVYCTKMYVFYMMTVCLPPRNPIFASSMFVQCSFDQHVMTPPNPCIGNR